MPELGSDSGLGSNGGNGMLLKVVDLKKYFPITGGLLGRQVGLVKAVDGISFDIKGSETLGLVGESGCGKSTAGRAILQLHEPTSGQVYLRDTELTGASDEQLRGLRPKMQMIFQDPYASLNPRHPVRKIVGEPLVAHNLARGSELEDRVAHLLEIVGLRAEYLSRYPHAFSGGQRQRIGIARALALNPKLLFLDEPTSAVDSETEKTIIATLPSLVQEKTLIIVAHRRSTIREAERVLLLRDGRIQEIGTHDPMFAMKGRFGSMVA